ncbi:MAG: acetyl-CoA C-acetyltransferase [Magnetococcales bacterium]|nr:acetyl-CoA C-acetyltransferase [Magnetococcales bacterium]
MNTHDRRSVFIVDGARTPQLKARGVQGPFSASDLAVAAGRPLMDRQPISPEDLDELIIGCVMPAPDEVNIGRIVALRLGCGHEVTAWTVQRNCGSGMQALDSATRQIESGYADLILAGGTEAMSRAPLQWRAGLVDWFSKWSRAKNLKTRLHLLKKLKLRDLRPVITLLKGLTDPVAGLSMGQTAEKLAHRFDIGREEMDAYAVRSHQRLAEAQDQGRLKEEIIPLYDPDGSLMDHDDGLRRDSSREALSKLRPVFDRPFGVVTAGNSAQVSDGAAMLLLASGEAVERHGLKVLGTIHAAHWAGLPPELMGLGPVHAIPSLLKAHGLTLHDIDGWEINEAFATQVIACQRALADPDYCRQELGLEAPLGALDSARLNRDGGGISLGHPVGASGARIVLHLLQAMQARDERRGVAALCIGGGQGGAVLLERQQGGGQ